MLCHGPCFVRGAADFLNLHAHLVTLRRSCKAKTPQEVLPQDVKEVYHLDASSIVSSFNLETSQHAVRGMIVSEKMPAQAALPAWNQEVWLINESMQEHSVMSEDSVCPLIAPPPSTCNCGSFANRGYGNETLQLHCGHDLQVERQQRPRG